jgi:hypothetical protein
MEAVMHKAKAFFYVCAGLFLLALSYHLGARSARAQVGGSVEAAGVANGFNAVVGRTLYTMSFSGSPLARPPVPGSDPIVAADGNESGNQVLLASGDAYFFKPTGTPGGWVFQGNLFGAPTPAERTTFGNLKARYH